MSLIDFLCIAGGLVAFGVVFASGFFGERLRILELEPFAVGGAL